MAANEQAPDVELLDSNGRAVSLSDYWQARLTAFVFLRYLGCIFCREQVKDLRDHASELAQAGAQVVLIAPARPEAAAEFVARYRLPFPLLCDPRREAYRAYGLTDGTIGQLASPRIIARAAMAALRGTLPGKQDARLSRQLPGAAIVDREGRLRLMHAARDAADHLGARELLEAAGAIRSEDATMAAVS